MKLAQRPSPKMKSTYKEPLSEATIAAWKYLGFIILVLFFAWMLMQVSPTTTRYNQTSTTTIILGK